MNDREMLCLMISQADEEQRNTTVEYISEKLSDEDVAAAIDLLTELATAAGESCESCQISEPFPYDEMKP